MIKSKRITSEIIYKNDHINNIYAACTCCYNNAKMLTYLDKVDYIKKRIDAGHESVLEHGRLAMKISNIQNTDLIADLTTLDYSKYLKFYSIHKEDDTYTLIINGDMRAYKVFLTSTEEDDYLNNKLIREIHKMLIDNTIAALYGKDFKMSNMYDSSTSPFIAIETFNEHIMNNHILYDLMVNKEFSDISYDIVEDTRVKMNDANKLITLGFDSNVLGKLYADKDLTIDMINDILCTTVVFRNISRTATHQLVRHRNAITQESQRYVNYSNATFTVPVPDYDKEQTYKITLFGVEKEITLDELGKELMSVYPQLVGTEEDKKNNQDRKFLKKEEARAFLPSNVDCGKLYMTFSISNLLKFIELRTDPHAQYEIRKYAESVRDTFDAAINTRIGVIEK